MKANLRNGKRYLKYKYQSKIGIDEACPDYCLLFSLTEDNQPSFSSNCEHDHDLECERCVEFSNTLTEIIEILTGSDNMTERQRQEFEFEVRLQ